MKVTTREGNDAALYTLEQRAMKRVLKTRYRMKVSGKSVFVLKKVLTKEKK